MNPHAPQPISIIFLVVSLWRKRQLIVQKMTKRKVVGRYKGSVMGLLWSFHNPVFMLVLFAAFVFFNSYLHWNAIFIPLVLLPLCTHFWAETRMAWTGDLQFGVPVYGMHWLCLAPEDPKRIC